MVLREPGLLNPSRKSLNLAGFNNKARIASVIFQPSNQAACLKKKDKLIF